MKTKSMDLHPRRETASITTSGRGSVLKMLRCSLPVSGADPFLTSEAREKPMAPILDETGKTMRKKESDMTIRPTRFPELGYRNDGSKVELLADLGRYAREYGCGA